MRALLAEGTVGAEVIGGLARCWAESHSRNGRYYAISAAAVGLAVRRLSQLLLTRLAAYAHPGQVLAQLLHLLLLSGSGRRSA